MVTIREIAANTGVTVSTVSRALAGRPGLKADTVQRVVREAERLGYTPNLMARGLVRRRSGMIGVALPALDYAHGDFFTRLLIGIEKRAAALKYMLLLFPYMELEGPGMMQQSLLDGIMIIGPMEPARFASISIRKPLVVLDQNLPGVASITSENRAGAGKAVKHLHGLGHRRFLFLGGPPDHPTVADRLEGFLAEGRRLSGHAFRAKSVFADWTNFESGGETVIRELRAGEKFTAIVAANDALAVSAVLALQDHGFGVPRDFSVVGFDDSVDCQVVRPKLTSVRQLAFEMGGAAMTYLDHQICGSKRKPRASWEQHLVARDSTARAPEGAMPNRRDALSGSSLPPSRSGERTTA